MVIHYLEDFIVHTARMIKEHLLDRISQILEV